jgi:hypothetical protein
MVSRFRFALKILTLGYLPLCRKETLRAFLLQSCAGSTQDHMILLVVGYVIVGGSVNQRPSSASHVVFVQFEPVTAKLYFHVPKPLPVTERPPSVILPAFTHAGALYTREL